MQGLEAQRDPDTKGLVRFNVQRKPQVGRLGDIEQLSVFRLLQEFWSSLSASLTREVWKDHDLGTEGRVKAIAQRPWSWNLILKIVRANQGSEY